MQMSSWPGLEFFEGKWGNTNKGWTVESKLEVWSISIIIIGLGDNQLSETPSWF